MENRIGSAATGRTATTQADEALRRVAFDPAGPRAVAEQIAGLIAQLRYLNTGLATDPDYTLRLVDGRTGEHLATAFMDATTADTLRAQLEAQVDGSRPNLHVVGGGQ